MVKYIDVDIIRKDIEKKSHEEQGFRSEDSEYGYRSCARDLLAFIDSLQQEQEQYVIGGQVFGATDIEQLYKGKVYIVSKLVQDKEFGIYPGKRVKMLLIKD